MYIAVFYNNQRLTFIPELQKAGQYETEAKKSMKAA